MNGYIELICETCGREFYRKKSDHKYGRSFCTQQCWLSKHNNPERNAQVLRDTAQQRAETIRQRGDESGIWYRKVNDVHEHRTVMEKKLGRKLLPGEIVHHIDEDKRNNDPDNLEVMTRAEHARHHFSK